MGASPRTGTAAPQEPGVHPPVNGSRIVNVTFASSSSGGEAAGHRPALFCKGHVRSLHRMLQLRLAGLRAGGGGGPEFGGGPPAGVPSPRKGPQTRGPGGAGAACRALPPRGRGLGNQPYRGRVWPGPSGVAGRGASSRGAGGELGKVVTPLLPPPAARGAWGGACGGRGWGHVSVFGVMVPETRGTGTGAAATWAPRASGTGTPEAKIEDVGEAGGILNAPISRP